MDEEAAMSKVTTSTFLVCDVEPATTLLEEVPYKAAVETLLKTAAPNRRLRSVEACARYHGQLIAGVPLHPVVAAAHRAFMDHRPLCLSPDIIWLTICQGVANHINAHGEELRSRFVSHEGKIEISVRRDDFVKGSPENPWAEVIEELTNKVKEHIGSAFDLFQPTFTTTGPVEKAAAAVVLLDAMKSYFDYDMMTECGIPAITLEGTAEDWQVVADRTDQFGLLNLEWWFKPLRAVLRQFVAAVQGEIDRPFWRSLYKYQDESGGPVITGWISTLFPYLKDGRTGLATNRNRWLTSKSQRKWEGEIGEVDDEIQDDEFNWDDEKIEKPSQHVTTPAPQKTPTRLILDRNQDMEDPNPKDALDAESPSVSQQPDRIVPSTRENRADPDLDSDFDADDDDESVVGAWLRPMPRGKWLHQGYYFGVGWGPRISDLPSGISRAPFCWHYRKQSFNMQFLGGFVGVSQDKETLAVKPEIGWAVREALKQV
jgi:hypothetical protein